MHLVSQPIDLPACIAEDDGLSNRHRLIQIAKRIKLPLFLFYRNIELLDTFECQLITLHENPNRVPHEFLRHIKHFRRHRGREKDYLNILRKHLENLIDLILESTGEHFISFVEAKDFDVIGAKCSSVDHIEYPARSSNNDVNTGLERGHVLTDICASDTGMALDTHVIPECNDHFLDLLGELPSRSEDERLCALDGQIELLENGDGERRGLASTRLGLRNDIVPLDDRDNRTLLDRRGAFKTVDQPGQSSSTPLVATTPNSPVGVDTP